MLNIPRDTADSVVMTDGSSQPPTTVYSPGDVAWVMAATALVWIMTPGVGLFYSGLLRRKNALSRIYLSMMTMAIVSFQWFLWGFSLTFSDTGSTIIGNLKYFALRDVLENPSISGNLKIPSIVFCIYQLTFAAFTPMLALGGFAERAHLGPLLVFVFAWSTLVYDPIAYWTWNANGWGSKLGSIDFAGGTLVHISSGTAALAISFHLKKRHGFGTAALAYVPHNTTYVVLGTTFFWLGSFGVSGGSAFGANLRAAQSCLVSNLAASVGGLTWIAWDYRFERKWSTVGFCSGVIAGLVAGSGYVGSPAALLYGFMAGTLCNFATRLKFYLNCDDAHDIFASHSIGGLVGNILTALFAQQSIAAYDGSEISGGWLDQYYAQLGIHLADSLAGLLYSFAMTTAILWDPE